VPTATVADPITEQITEPIRFLTAESRIKPLQFRSDKHPQRRYYRKEILRVGDFHVRGRYLPVTRQTLLTLAKNFQTATSRGIRIPVIWNHSEDARDTIGDVTQLRAEGGVLYASFWAAHPNDISRLGITNNEVSVELSEDWTDGLGNDYDLMLTHVGVVNLPVVPNQQPFERLQLSHKRSGAMAVKTKVRLQTEGQATGGEGADENPEIPNEMDAQTIADWVNEILAASGSPLLFPDGTSEANFMDRLFMLKEQSKAGEKAEEEPPPDAGNGDAAVVDVTPPNMPMEEQFALVKKRNQELTQQLALIKTREQNERKSQFASRLESLIKTGRLIPSEKANMIGLGEECGWKLSLLSPFEKLEESSAVPTRRRAQMALATVDDGMPKETGNLPSDERRAEVKKSFWKR
jgi:hypothetical protein